MNTINTMRGCVIGGGSRCLQAVALLLIVLLSSSCATTSQHSPGSRKEDFYVTSERVIIMPAILKYISISNDAPLDPTAYHGEEAGDFLQGYSAELLRKKGFIIISAESLSKEDPGFRTAYGEILSERINLFRSPSAPALTDELKVLAESSGNAGILIFMLKVKVGPSGAWDPVSGAIKSSFSYTRLKALLLETGSGRELWSNEVQIREIPAADSRGYKEAVRLLLEDLKTVNGGQNARIVN